MKKKNNKEKNSLFTLALALVLTIALSCAFVYAYYRVYKTTQSNLISSAEDKITLISDSTSSFLKKAKTAVAADSATIEYLIDEGASNEDILHYLLEQTDYYLSGIDENFTGLYGYYRGEYLDGNRWDPYADGARYYPRTRPWYRAALKGDGEVSVASPYLDMDTGNIVLSVTKLLSDKESVFGLDISLANLSKNITDYMDNNSFDYSYIIDSTGTVVASRYKEDVGVNYLGADGSKDTLGIKEVFSKALTNDDTFDYVINNKKYLVISKTIENNWQVIVMADAQSIYSPLTRTAGALLTLLVGLILTMVFLLVSTIKERRDRIKAQNAEQKYLIDLNNVNGQLSNYKRAVLSDALISLEVNLDKDDLYYGVWKDDNGKEVPLKEILGIETPCSYDKYIELWNNRFVKEFSSSSSSFSYSTDREYLIETFKNGHTEITFDYQARTINGRKAWLRRSIAMTLNQDGEIVAYTSVKDISSLVEQTKREEEYIRALSTEYDSIVVVNFDNDKVRDEIALRSHVSSDITSLLGKEVIEENNYTKRLDAMAKRIHPEDREAFIANTRREEIQKTFAKNQSHYVDFRIINKDEPIYYQISFVPLKDEENNAIGMIACLRNIDEEMKLEAEKRKYLEEATIAAEAANTAKSVFLFNMSHDIRTPMNAIIGFTDMAKKHIDDKEKVEEYLNKVSTSSDHLLTLINDVLDMSRVESGQVTIEEEPICIDIAKDNLLSIVSGNANEKNITITSIIDSSIKNHWIYCDRLRTMRIMTNIVSNSIKYTSPGGKIEIVASELPCDKPGYARYRYTIADNGIGMSKEYLEHIFEAFTREKSSTVSRIQGTGLGMAITKSLVDLMGGTIEVESELGKGTKTTLEFDYRIAEPVKATGSESSIDLSYLSGKHILLVEDNEMNREIATDILEEVGFVIDSAEDGTIAVDKIRDNGDAYDIVLMDIQMPIMNGYDATRAIRQFNKDIPIVAMTANAFEEDKKAALEAGMNDHVAKPIDVDLLKETIAKYIR